MLKLILHKITYKDNRKKIKIYMKETELAISKEN